MAGRSLLPRGVRLLVGFILPFAFIRALFMLVFDPTDHCSSSIWCFPQRIFGRSDSAILMEETAKILLKTISTKEVDDWSGVEKTGTGAENFNDLVHDMMSNGQDIKYFAFMTKDVITKMEHMVRKAKLRESLNWYLAARGVPKSLHCLTLELADEYSTNAEARSNLIHPQHMYRLIDHSFHHLVLLTDNVLAASVVVSSVVNASANPEKLVFHVVTDKITYASMHAWFAMNAFAIGSAVVEVKGLHQYDWTRGINTSMKQLLEIHHQICRVEYQTLRREDLSVLTPSCNSFLNVLRMYLPELFQDLNKVVLLDDDVIVQHDLSSLWDLDLDHKVMGAVVDSNGHHECCSCHKYSDYFNFTDSIISSNVDPDTCGWLFGVNVLDLKRWRQTNITASYLHWLERNLNAGFMLWRYPGVLPPALLAFENQVHHIKSSWQLSKMGEPRTGLDKHKAEAAAVLHFSGPAKPWLEMAPTEVQGLWYKHVNFSNEHIRRCGVSGSPGTQIQPMGVGLGASSSAVVLCHSQLSVMFQIHIQIQCLCLSFIGSSSACTLAARNMLALCSSASLYCISSISAYNSSFFLERILPMAFSTFNSKFFSTFNFMLPILSATIFLKQN